MPPFFFSITNFSTLCTEKTLLSQGSFSQQGTMIGSHFQQAKGKLTSAQ
jgi:hypothetical protein